MAKNIKNNNKVTKKVEQKENSIKQNDSDYNLLLDKSPKETKELPNHRKIISEIEKEYDILRLYFNSFNSKNDKISSQINNLFSRTESGIKSLYSINNLNLIDKVRQAKTSFEELSYDIEAIISKVIYPGDSPYARKTSGGFVYSVEYSKNVNKIKDLENEINILLDSNEIESQLQDLLDNLISYGFSYVYFYNNYSKIMVISSEDLEIVKSNESGKRKRGAYNITVDLLESKIMTCITKVIDDVSNLKFKIGDRELDPNYLYIVTNKPGKIQGKSLIGKIIKYLIIIATLEVVQTLERIGKSKILHLLLFDISNIDQDAVIKFATLYSDIMKNRMAVDLNESGEISFDFIKGLVDNYAILPVEGQDKLKIETLKSEYKPVNLDLYYWQKKVYYTLGIPPQIHSDAQEQATALPKEFFQFTSEVFDKKVKIYRYIINKFISLQIRQYLYTKYEIDSNVKVSILDYSEFMDRDIEYLNKFVDLIFKLMSAGIMIKEKWLIKNLFPNSDPDDIVFVGVPGEDVLSDETIDKLMSSKIIKEPYNKNTFRVSGIYRF